MHILSLDGGGYLGLATASFIRAIERYASIRFAEHFELFCGTSTGALIALALASGKTGDELVELYRAMGSRVFAKGLRPRYGLLGPKYRNTHLRQVLEEQFGAATLGDALKRGKKVLVTAFNISTGKPRIFKTDHAKYLKRDRHSRRQHHDLDRRFHRDGLGRSNGF